MSNKKEAFAVLDNYPKDGPEMPERGKVHREKNKHESGTGRRDREKREGRGQSNWGNALDDQLAEQHHHEEEEYDDEHAETPKEHQEFKPAGEYFKDDDENEENKKVSKQTVKVPPGYGKIVKAGDGVEVVEEDESHDPDRKLPKPQPKLEKKPKREPYHPEKEESQQEEEEEKNENVKPGKKPRDQQFHGPQHNRSHTSQAPPQKGGP
ncbi:hypothetical protein M9Y10_021191 [Tritrichomonas musculus]|uniref:Hyaluronan/mRNA-binding protein domain-containing protein n=1 Tax=Tritrichomonas musculus TaxID=1915356 RepID=A0ABR2HFI9_9EUKA